MIRALAAALALTLLGACATIGVFNAATPHQESVARVVQSAAYGEGPRRTLDVYAPVHGAANAPVVVFFYGGGWQTGAKDDHRFVGEAFAAEGFVTVVPDYRLYPEVRYPEFLNDSAAAVRWVQDNIARYGGDPHRIVLMGHSAGAYDAVMIGVDPEYLRAAGADPRNIRGVVGLAGPYRFGLDAPIIRTVFAGAPDARATQPALQVRRGAPPLLLLHGARDRRVPSLSSEVMSDAATVVGERAEARIYPSLDHPLILQALAVQRHGDSPVFADSVAFARQVTIDAPLVARAGD
jgi:acetyl esterase/lipase